MNAAEMDRLVSHWKGPWLAGQLGDQLIEALKVANDAVKEAVKNHFFNLVEVIIDFIQ